jgi:hypothetical protein
MSPKYCFVSRCQSNDVVSVMCKMLHLRCFGTVTTEAKKIVHGSSHYCVPDTDIKIKLQFVQKIYTFFILTNSYKIYDYHPTAIIYIYIYIYIHTYIYIHVTTSGGCYKLCGRNLITGLTSAASPRVNISSNCKVGQKLGVSLPLLTCSPSA